MQLVCLRMASQSRCTSACPAPALPCACPVPGPALQDGRIFEGRLVNYDTISDLAVLKVEADSPLPTAKLGESPGERVMEWCRVGCKRWTRWRRAGLRKRAGEGEGEGEGEASQRAAKPLDPG